MAFFFFAVIQAAAARRRRRKPKGAMEGLHARQACATRARLGRKTPTGWNAARGGRRWERMFWRQHSLRSRQGRCMKEAAVRPPLRCLRVPVWMVWTVWEALAARIAAAAAAMAKAAAAEVAEAPLLHPADGTRRVPRCCICLRWRRLRQCAWRPAAPRCCRACWTHGRRWRVGATSSTLLLPRGTARCRSSWGGTTWPMDGARG
mmetsp:Transcript_15868/g.46940  ORF Transcript_15868/g.46940 Transcript_15868/m.46940 type:complete len:205 (+) Transcript_15868:381-995(+)